VNRDKRNRVCNVNKLPREICRLFFSTIRQNPFQYYRNRHCLHIRLCALDDSTAKVISEKRLFERTSQPTDSIHLRARRRLMDPAECPRFL